MFRTSITFTASREQPSGKRMAPASSMPGRVVYTFSTSFGKRGGTRLRFMIGAGTQVRAVVPTACADSAGEVNFRQLRLTRLWRRRPLYLA
jgi:hypothetical protein